MDMPAPEPHHAVTASRSIRIDDDDWTDFGKLVGPKKRNTVIKQFIQAALDRPGSAIPACLSHHVFREIHAALKTGP